MFWTLIIVAMELKVSYKTVPNLNIKSYSFEI